MTGNEATSKAEIRLKAGYGISFNTDYSIAPMLGFDKEFEATTPGKYVGEHIVNISKISNIFFNCNISEMNYLNDKPSPYLMNVIVDVPSGYRLSRELQNLLYKRLRFLNKIKISTKSPLTQWKV